MTVTRLKAETDALSSLDTFAIFQVNRSCLMDSQSVSYCSLEEVVIVTVIVHISILVDVYVEYFFEW